MKEIFEKANFKESEFTTIGRIIHIFRVNLLIIKK